MEITEQYRKLAYFYDGVLKEESLAPECYCLKYCILGKKNKIKIIFLYLLSRIEIDNMDSTFLITKFVLQTFLNTMVMKSSIKQYPVLNWSWLNMSYASVWYKQHYIICFWWLWVWYMSRNLVFRYDLQLS